MIRVIIGTAMLIVIGIAAAVLIGIGVHKTTRYD